ncbi:MAG TPA: hypothetical protein VMU83_11800, partial [Hanamia sp.]|nr:hypothetical protein [Hanamia sp.]HUZ59454.1 hypothetical protein [Hanamia sp.]
PHRVSISAFSSCRLCIYSIMFRTVIGLLYLWLHHPHYTAYIQFLFVGANFCRCLPSDSTSQWTPLPLANTPYCKAYSGLTPYS